LPRDSLVPFFHAAHMDTDAGAIARSLVAIGGLAELAWGADLASHLGKRPRVPAAGGHVGVRIRRRPMMIAVLGCSQRRSG